MQELADALQQARGAAGSAQADAEASSARIGELQAQLSTLEARVDMLKQTRTLRQSGSFRDPATASALAAASGEAAGAAPDAAAAAALDRAEDAAWQATPHTGAADDVSGQEGAPAVLRGALAELRRHWGALAGRQQLADSVIERCGLALL